jgi:acid phosphatase (class A)
MDKPPLSLVYLAYQPSDKTVFDHKPEVSNSESRYPTAWHPAFLAQAVMAEFSVSEWKGVADTPFPPPNNDKPELEKEIKQLLYLAGTVRQRRMGEIIAQAADVRPYWNSLIGASLTGTPAACTLIEVGLAVGQMVAMHFKYKFNRQRPFQIYPALLPPISTPPHSSYPNGHALQSFLIAGCLADACPNIKPVVDALAHRIGANREVAGVHFGTDREVSRQIADRTMEALREGSLFKQLVATATRELSGFRPVTVMPGEAPK